MWRWPADLAAVSDTKAFRAECGCSARRVTLSDEGGKRGIRSGCAGSSGPACAAAIPALSFDHQRRSWAWPREGTIPIILVPDVASCDKAPCRCGHRGRCQLTGGVERSFFACPDRRRRESRRAGSCRLFRGATRHSVSAIIAETLVVLLAMIAASSCSCSCSRARRVAPSL